MLLSFHQATASDLPTVLGALDEAAAWLKSRSIRQWPDRFSDANDWRMSRISKYVSEGRTWLVRAHSKPIATFSLTNIADPDYAEGWPGGPDRSLYIFRIAVRRTWSGRDIGSRILDWASMRASAGDGLWLRLDCHRDNLDLQQYYEARGFDRVNTLVKTIDDQGRPYTRGSGALYQRPAGTLYSPS
ncbi:GNAT family N-acetyltransferase [Micromonospora sp. LOL_023]|uniref:GNAT family N-acetyltransferase n=1 Tax=Micromonospora sp. LOL_023 TaxID=3345418 RepID=UPI003A8375C6